MHKTIILAALSALIFTGTIRAAIAAKPTSIAFESKGNTAGLVKFSNYIVKCSNGKRQPLTEWDNRKKWCVGQESQENCHRKQMAAAKTACKIN